MIRNTIECYNALAQLQNPPRPHLVYSEVVEYCNFSEFKILKQSDHDILSKEWATITNRQVAKKYFKLKRAKEKVCHCNIEVACLQAWVNAEDAEMCRAIATHEESDPMFAAHLRAIQMQCRHVNDCLHTWLQQIYRLPSYCGPHQPAANSLPVALASNSTLSSAAMQSL